MEVFETRLASATQASHLELLAAIGVVLDSTGKPLYRHASGRQKLDPNAQHIDKETTICMGSSGNFITHIATLQLVERGVVGLDESVLRLLPELAELPIISSSEDSPTGFTLRSQKKTMTVRHLLTHSSGIPGDDNPLIETWRRVTPSKSWHKDTHPIVKRCSWPLLFEPGEGWQFGHSVHWLQVLITRGSGEDFVDYIYAHLFQPLGMKLSMYPPQQAHILDRCLQAVKRESCGNLVVAQDAPFSKSLMCSISDVMQILRELISPSPRILSIDSVATLLEPAFLPESSAWEMLRANTDYYAAPVGLSHNQLSPPVNFSCAGSLVVMDDLPESKFPAGTVTWNGSPNVVWAVHPDKGVAILFATQFAPEDDPITVSIMMEFFRGVRSSYLQD